MVLDPCLIPNPCELLLGECNKGAGRSYLDTNLLVYGLLLVLDLLLELLELGTVGRGAVRLQYLDVPVAVLAQVLCRHSAVVVLLIGEGCDLLLFHLVVGEVLLVLLPAAARGAGHVCGESGGVGGWGRRLWTVVCPCTGGSRANMAETRGSGWMRLVGVGADAGAGAGGGNGSLVRHSGGLAY